jgi:hypothetical protein
MLFKIDEYELEATLRAHVDLLAGLIGPRTLAMPRAFHAAAAYVERQLGDAGYDVARQTYSVDGEEVANFIAELPGGRRKDEIVIVGAHYDTVPGTPGADDNASAAAVLIEVSRMMRPLETARTVRLVSFVCEERRIATRATWGAECMRASAGTTLSARAGHSLAVRSKD